MIRLLPGLLCAAGLSHATAASLDTPSVDELRARCRTWLATPDDPAGWRCPSYVRGYLDGLARGDRLRAARSEPGESWTDRAARTRLSRSQLARTSRCMLGNVPLGGVVERFVQYVESAQESRHETAAGALEATLRLHYCD